jgi:hypothetical protein
VVSGSSHSVVVWTHNWNSGTSRTPRCSIADNLLVHGTDSRIRSERFGCSIAGSRDQRSSLVTWMDPERRPRQSTLCE